MSTMKNSSKQFIQAVFMTDASEPNKSTMVTEDDNEHEDSGWEGLFEEDVEDGWTGVTSNFKAYHTDQGDNAKDQQPSDRSENAKRRLHHELTKTVPAVAEIAQVLAKVGVGLLAEGLGYVYRETRETLISSLPTMEDLTTAMALGRERATMDEYNLPRNHPARLAASWKYPPSLGVQDPRDAPSGSNLDSVAIMPMETAQRSRARRDDMAERYREGETRRGKNRR